MDPVQAIDVDTSLGLTPEIPSSCYALGGQEFQNCYIQALKTLEPDCTLTHVPSWDHFKDCTELLVQKVLGLKATIVDPVPSDDPDALRAALHNSTMESSCRVQPDFEFCHIRLPIPQCRNIADARQFYECTSEMVKRSGGGSLRLTAAQNVHPHHQAEEEHGAVTANAHVSRDWIKQTTGSCATKINNEFRICAEEKFAHAEQFGKQLKTRVGGHALILQKPYVTEDTAVDAQPIEQQTTPPEAAANSEHQDTPAAVPSSINDSSQGSEGQPRECKCPHGTLLGGQVQCGPDGIGQCSSCDATYHLTETKHCSANRCICPGGEPASRDGEFTPQCREHYPPVEQCAKCHTDQGYVEVMEGGGIRRCYAPTRLKDALFDILGARALFHRSGRPVDACEFKGCFARIRNECKNGDSASFIGCAKTALKSCCNADLKLCENPSKECKVASKDFTPAGNTQDAQYELFSWRPPKDTCMAAADHVAPHDAAHPVTVEDRIAVFKACWNTKSNVVVLEKGKVPGEITVKKHSGNWHDRVTADHALPDNFCADPGREFLSDPKKPPVLSDEELARGPGLLDRINKLAQSVLGIGVTWKTEIFKDEANTRLMDASGQPLDKQPDIVPSGKDPLIAYAENLDSTPYPGRQVDCAPSMRHAVGKFIQYLEDLVYPRHLEIFAKSPQPGVPPDMLPQIKPYSA
eukprot:GEMP01024068.1.p1 GENE.GEMP01024068.1~~GEMP01024068.1.p1  ORF type:complete len:693 (+),score=165.97 GEMP01024068.1:139-2217(+)